MNYLDVRKIKRDLGLSIGSAFALVGLLAYLVGDYAITAIFVFIGILLIFGNLN